MSGSRFGAAVDALLMSERLPSLGPGSPVRSMRPALAALDTAALLDGAVPADPEMARACLAGLWLHFDFLDDSHRISQELSNTTGSYWHGIMHRREPDYANAKYWFRRVGNHPVFEPLAAESARLAAAAGLSETTLLASASWDPFAFVDLCQQAYRQGDDSPLALLCRQVQRAEWQLLFDYGYQLAQP